MNAGGSVRRQVRQVRQKRVIQIADQTLLPQNGRVHARGRENVVASALAEGLHHGVVRVVVGEFHFAVVRHFEQRDGAGRKILLPRVDGKHSVFAARRAAECGGDGEEKRQRPVPHGWAHPCFFLFFIVRHRTDRRRAGKGKSGAGNFFRINFVRLRES